MMQEVATPLRAQRADRALDFCGKDTPLPEPRSFSVRASTLAKFAKHAKHRVVKKISSKRPGKDLTDIATAEDIGNTAIFDVKKKISSKRPGKDLTDIATAEDVGWMLPKPSKRCKLLEPCDEPSASMRDMEAIVVNLERRPDRMAGCSERFKLNAPWVRHSRFSAADGRRDAISLDEVVVSWNTASNVEYQKKRAIRKGWNDLDTYQIRDLELSPGERGCALSHIRAWRYCLERCGGTDRPLLVLEDDAAPTPDFTPVLRRALDALPSDAHVLYLGYSQAAEWRREVSADLVECEYVWTTVAYLVWPVGARMLLSRLPVDGPVDNWMAGQCAAGDIKAYAVRPKIVRQADAWNVNSDVAHSDEHYWGPNSDIHHSDAFYWGNPSFPEPSANGATLPNIHNGLDRSTTIWADIDADSDDMWADSDESGLEC